MARHSSPRPPSAPFRFSPPRLPLAPALAPAGVPAGLPLPGPATPRTPRYPDVSAFTGGRPDAVDTAHPGTATPPPLTRTDRRHAPAADRPSPRHPVPGPGPQPTNHPGRPRPTGEPASSAATALRGRAAAAAVAVGALATAGHSLGAFAAIDPSTTELAASSLSLASAASDETPATRDATAGPHAGSGIDAATSGVLAVTNASEHPTQLSSLAKGQKRAQEAVARAQAARAPQFVKPAQGRFTSGYGARWGSSHKGVDIAGPIGTPIVAVASGTVTAAGPASGFGQWVKVRLADGTETVYGHVNRFFVSEGDTVKAGEEIAEIGNRGQSTGPHLHFEVHTPGGTKINPQPWLAERGITLGAQQD